jgi:hypothetical protein
MSGSVASEAFINLSAAAEAALLHDGNCAPEQAGPVGVAHHYGKEPATRVVLD